MPQVLRTIKKFVRSHRRDHRSIAIPLLLVVLFHAVPAHALELLPPLPRDCVVANKSDDLADKVRLYTSCLEGGGIDIHTGIKMQGWQRLEMHFKRGNALFGLGRHSEAMVDYDLFIAKSGGHVWAYHQRGLTRLAMGQNQKAVDNFDEALKQNPDAIAVRYDRGSTLAKMGRYQLALEDLRRAASLSPETALFVNELAWLLATCPIPDIQNGNEAINFARKAVSIERSASHLDTLAAALARAGDFVQAVQIQTEAIEQLQKERAEQNYINAFKRRLNLYSESKPYTEDMAN